MIAMVQVERELCLCAGSTSKSREMFLICSVLTHPHDARACLASLPVVYDPTYFIIEMFDLPSPISLKPRFTRS